MRVLIRQFLGKNHSWSVCGWGIATALKQLGHQVDLFSTDGVQHLPEQLKENLIGYMEENQQTLHGNFPDSNYDCQISYTALKNFPYYFTHSNKNRFGIWLYEWGGINSLPTGFAKHYKSCDILCAPSNFGKKVFMDSGVPESHINVIPHGINSEQYSKDTKISLPTQKKFKILANIAQNHLRKNIPGMLEAYGKAFTNKDDVCLIIKGKEKPIVQTFDISLNKCINIFKQKFPNHGEIKIFTEFIPDISELYRSVDAVFTLAFAEGFFFFQDLRALLLVN